MVDNEPISGVVYVSEAVTRGEELGLSILDIGKRVVARIHSRIAVHADQLITESNLEAR
jgi:hypothetical protein